MPGMVRLHGTGMFTMVNFTELIQNSQVHPAVLTENPCMLSGVFELAQIRGQPCA
jgi:hypothetical protein